jgi:nucleoid-associated protein YgaU
MWWEQNFCKEKSMFFVNKKTVFAILLMAVLGMSVVWGGGNKEQLLGFNNDGHREEFASSEDAKKHIRPDWTEVRNGKLWEENGMIYVIQLYTPELSDKRRKIIEDEARRVNKNNAQIILGEFTSLLIDTAGSSSSNRIDIDKIIGKTENRKTTRTSELTTTINTTAQHLMSGIKVEGYYGEEWVNKKNITVWWVWEKYSVPKTVVEAARNKQTEDARKLKEAEEKGAKAVQDLQAAKQKEQLENEKTLFSETEKKYETTVKTLEDDLNSSFSTQYPSRYNSDFNEIIAVEVNLARLTTFIQTEEPAQKTEDKTKYEGLINRIKNDKEKYNPSDIQRLSYETQVRKLEKERDDFKTKVDTLTTERNAQQTRADTNREDYEKLLARVNEDRPAQNNSQQQGSGFQQTPTDYLSRLDSESENLLAALDIALSMTSIQSAERYTVKRGDYLAKIAREHYEGNAFYWPLIYVANSEKINSKNPNVIPVGTVLVIPPLPKSMVKK